MTHRKPDPELLDCPYPEFDIHSEPVEHLLKKFSYQENTLKGKTVLLTGGARGIGRQTVIGLSSLGAQVVFVDYRDQGFSVAEEAGQIGKEPIFLKLDISEEENIKSVVTYCDENFGGIDILINNAVQFEIHSVVDTPLSKWDYAFQTNVRAPMLLSKLCIPIMARKGTGTIINMIALEGMAFASAMSASKVSLRSLTISLAAEIKDTHPGIHVFGFAPGLVATPLVAEVFPKYASQLGIEFRTYCQEYVHNVGYEGLMPPEHCAAGLIDRIIHGKEHRGLLVEPYHALHRVGIIDAEMQLDARQISLLDDVENASRLRDYIREIRDLNHLIEGHIDERTTKIRKEKEVVENMYHLLQAQAEELQKTKDALEARTSHLAKAISKQDAYYAKLVHTSKLASLGTLAAGVAHELNNPLTVILGFTQTLRKSCSDDQKFMFDHILNYGQKMTQIVRHLQNFARDEGNESFSALNLPEVIKESFTLFHEKLNKLNVAVELNLDENSRVYGHKSQLISVFQNFISNSIEAFNQDHEEKKRQLTVHVIANDTSVKVQFIDNGPGIPRDIQSKVFDPFFTTKSGPSRSGLGLAISHEIITKHDGTVTLTSEPGIGSTIELEFRKVMMKSA